MNTHSHIHSALRGMQATAARPSACRLATAQSLMIVAAGVFFAAASIQPVFAADAQPPRVSGSDIKADGKIANVKAKGVPGQSTRGGGTIGYGSFNFGGSASKSSGALDGAVSSGIAVVNDGARVSGSDITARGVVTNSTTTGATLRAGIVTVGSN